MKPKKLILCGWGPYKNKQEINFEQLDGRGLFLITGPTGAGKTTLFDAITYALYGNMSGLVREKNSVRSDFAGEDIPTYVELFMTHAGECYHIYRNPEYLRPKKRKTGTCDMTKEKERAVLTLPDGSKIEGGNEVSNKIREILRLDYRQFKQLSLIAQGEFAKLMTASSGEKSRILREIFDTELFDKAAGLLRGRSGSLFNQVKEYRHKIEEDVAFFTPMEENACRWQELTGSTSLCYDEILSFLQDIGKEQEGLLKEINLKSSKIQQEVDLLTAQVAEAERRLSLEHRYEEEKKKKEKLSEQTLLMTEYEERLSKAQRALSVKTYEQAWQYAAQKAQELLLKNTALEEETERMKGQLKEKTEFVSKQKLIELAYEQRQQEQLLSEQQKELSDSLAKQQKALSSLQEEYLSAEKKELEAKADYEKADQSYRHAIAGILANDLQDEVPCPVCGSLHHPKKAVLSKDMPTAETVKEKKQLFERNRQESLALHGKTAACKERAESIAEAAATAREKREILLAEIEKQDSFVKEYTQKTPVSSFLQEKKACEVLQIQLEEKEGLIVTGRKEWKQQCIHEKEEAEHFERKCAENGFETKEAYHLAFMPEEEMENLRKVTAAYREEKHANEQMLLHLKEELSKIQLEDISILQEKLSLAKNRREEISSQQSARNHYVRDIRRLKDALQQKIQKQQKLETEYGIVKRLDDAANGNNRLRLMFEQYVLAAYFEEILKAANIRLRTMSSGRYELRRAETVGDGRKKDNLDMEVLDYYTGKYRSVKTLSGGESFKTSLALALGMSDVVQALSGGIKVETLFIDEGFGSLDSESLEQASVTLQSLVEKDRLIGIISHVPELAEKITNKIRIHKTNAGSRAEIVVS